MSIPLMSVLLEVFCSASCYKQASHRASAEVAGKAGGLVFS